MSKDLENITIIEQKIGRKLRQYDGNSLFDGDDRATYRLDKNQNIVGLNLCACDLSSILFLELLPNLTQLDLSRDKI
ncbi:MAG TPA: hypothetical protein DCQ37_03610, partial [Desulfobacteraceae bacterium]|nr:hypothetical protein [Desulfobacteraceae bacterium]